MENDAIKMVQLASIEYSVKEILDDFVRIVETQFGQVGQMVKSLEKALEQKKVSGWVVCHGGTPQGIVVYSCKKDMGRINFFHILPEYQDAGSLLIEKAVNTLREEGVGCIISEALILVDINAENIFKELGFKIFWRRIMSRNMINDIPTPNVLSGYIVISWDDSYIEEVITVLYEANREGIDRFIYPEFMTKEGTASMVRGLRAGAAGPFDENTSMLALYEGTVCGAILCAQQLLKEGFISEMAVSPYHQKKGLGTVLLTKSLQAAADQGLKKVRLGVTEENTAAVTLYCNLGFTTDTRLPAFVWNKN
jgi:ribosomal protein S18 acetylase RimI-like enzyme